MEFVDRQLEKTIIKALQPNKVVVLTGARRVGKTVLLNEIIKISLP